MPLPDFLIKNLKYWKVNTYTKNKKLFEEVTTKDQAPKAIIISCCDSRVIENSLFGGKIGDFFIHKNIANLIPQYNSGNINTSTISAIEYAVKALNVPHVIILGHSSCGGIRYVYDQCTKENIDKKFEFIDDWLNIIKPLFYKLPPKISEEEKITHFEQDSIKFSLKNLLSFPFIQKLVLSKKLQIHGIWYNIPKGNIMYISSDKQKFEKIDL